MSSGLSRNVTHCNTILHHKLLQLVTLTSVNHCICNVVNTSFFLICVFLCIHIHAPRHGPCLPTAVTAQLSALCNVMTCGESSSSALVHQHIEDMFSFNDLLVYDNCYGISCHAKAWTKQRNITPKVCCKADAQIHHPPSVMVIGRAAYGL